MDSIDRIRRFNRNHTHRLGLLRQGYLDAGLSLAEARVMFELTDRADWSARALGQYLGMNEGYLSRLLARLQTAGLLARAPSPRDGRVMVLSLTPKGRDRAADLTAMSRSQIGQWVDGQTPGAIDQLVHHMEAIDAQLSPTNAPVDLRDLAIGDAGWLIEQHGTIYGRDDGFDASFEALVAEILAAYIRDHDPTCERAWIAWQGGNRLGSVFCVKGPESGQAKLRLFLLTPEARGLGLGGRMLDACISYAREKGYGELVLWTHASHRAACALYKRRGFALTDSRAVTSFGQALEEQSWKLNLM